MNKEKIEKYEALRLNIINLQSVGNTLRDISNILNISLGSVHWYLHGKFHKKPEVKESKPKKGQQYDGLKERGRRYKMRYGITIEDYNNLYDSQKGCCSMCNKQLPKDGKGTNKLFIDHCHTTGKVRGLLCNRCNSGLGYFDKGCEFINMVKCYLNKYSQLY